jgi:hypothetical protein
MKLLPPTRERAGSAVPVPSVRRVHVHHWAVRLLFGFACTLIVLGCAKPKPVTPPGGGGGSGGGGTTSEPPGGGGTIPGAPNYSYLDQGWNQDQRAQFYFTTQGSQLIPYDWYLALEQPNSDKRFNDPEFIAALRFIPMAPDDDRNPDGLPIGIVKDDNPHSVVIKLSQIREDTTRNHYPKTNKWMGITCALCHTNRITYTDQSLVVDGAPTLGDVQGLLDALARSVQATLTDDQKMDRFARQVLGSGFNEAEASALRDEVDAYNKELQAEIVRDDTGDDPKMRYGFGRLDAFGRIMNSVAEVAPRIPVNHVAANAPVSFPFLWDTPMLEWVQWNGSTANPLGRNVGEVIGAFAQLRIADATPEQLFDSSADIEKLDRLETLLEGLHAPAWPEDILGKFDPDKVALGQKLFAKNCQACHSVRDSDGKFPTRENPVGPPLIKIVMVPLSKIGTDPTMAMNFVKGRVDPGILKAAIPPERIGPDGKVPGPVYLTAVVRAVMNRKYKELAATSPSFAANQDEIIRGLEGDRPSIEPSPEHLLGYKSRPMNGIWATAPYLHNGSVPNLYQLLLPAKDRVKKFHVGSREFEPLHVGFNTEPTADSFEFDTTLPGNSNAGHEGPLFTQTRPSDDEEYRDFTPEERTALVEYMKTLK